MSRRSRLGFLLLTTACAAFAGRPTVTVATIGDSFADSLYEAMHVRPDLMERHNVRLLRWSRPIVGLTRTDYFDYLKWLRDTSELGAVDVCLVQIGSNDMQSIPAAKNQWLGYGSPQWREAYAARTRDLASLLAERRCGIVVWVLQPGFEKRDAMACHRELINEVQRDVLRLRRTQVLEIATSESAYGPDKTHFNSAYILRLGPVLFQLVDTSRQILHSGCLACHRNVEPLAPNDSLRSWRREPQPGLWVPGRTGLQCRVAAMKKPAKAAQHHRRR